MTELSDDPRFTDPDGFYAALVARLDHAPDAVAFLSRLVLILGNEIGDQRVLQAAFEAADMNRESGR